MIESIHITKYLKRMKLLQQQKSQNLTEVLLLIDGDRHGTDIGIISRYTYKQNILITILIS